jgi:nucleotide-binding universal stress UspA family protein
MKILIAYDGSEGAEAALDDLPGAGLPGRAEALVVVTDVWLTPSPAEFTRTLARRRMLSADSSSFAPALRKVEEERALSREAVRRIRAHFPAWDVRAEAGAGMWAAAPSLLRRASSWGAELLVIGSLIRPAHDRAVGATVRQVAAEAPCSVRVARQAAGTPGGSAVRLLVSADGPPGLRVACSTVAAREWPHGSECRVIAGAQSGHGPAETLRAAGLKVSTVTPEVDLRRALIEEARRWDADCVFVGAPGRVVAADPRGPGCLITSLVANSPCTIEVARAPMQATAGAFLPAAHVPFHAAAAGAG